MSRLARTLAAIAVAVGIAGYAATEYLDASTPDARPTTPTSPYTPEPTPPDCTPVPRATSRPTTLPPALPTANPMDPPVEAHLCVGWHATVEER
ncbi:hypothetical protein [Streptomyces muensis]|uniref:Secreted protein n=1 Tax=Streptomyces muensis TaxID=1077944 RepID=A0A9X1TQT5_STRM4|nr:hypothetical protein [Streptomyces muensis]MCF1599500.1 hypothetical protein [Streptomyces muensis]